MLLKASRKPNGGMGFGNAVTRSCPFRSLSLGFLAPLPFGFGGLKIICNEPKQAYNVIFSVNWEFGRCPSMR